MSWVVGFKRRVWGQGALPLVMTVLAAALTGCGGGGGGGDGAGNGAAEGQGAGANAVATVAAVPSLGQFASGATVRLLKLDGTVLATGTIDADGQANLGVDVNTPGPFVIQVGKSGDRYFDEKAKAFVSINLPDGTYALRAALPSLMGEVGVSPYTEMAVGLLEGLPGGLASATVADILAANKAIEKLFRMSSQLFPRYANEPPPEGILTKPYVFDSVAMMFEPPAGQDTTPKCFKLPSGQEACEVAGPPSTFQGALGVDHAHALAIAVFPFLAASNSNVVQLIHDLRDDIRDGSFDLLKNGAFLPSVNLNVVADVITAAGTPVVVDGTGVLRRKSDNSLYGVGPGTVAYKRDFNVALMNKLTTVSLQMLKDYKGSALTYSGYMDFALGGSSFNAPLIMTLVKNVNQVAADYGNRLPAKSILSGSDAVIKKYNVAGLTEATAEDAKADIRTRFDSALAGPVGCDDGFVRNVAGVCVPGSDSSSGSGTSSGSGSALCSNVQFTATGALNLITLASGSIASAPANCSTDYYFVWSTDSTGPGTGSYEGSCKKARALYSTPRTACYCYTLSQSSAGSALLNGEKLCYVGF